MKECPRCLGCEDDSVSVCPGDGTPLNAGFGGSPLIDGKYLLERRLGEGGMGIIYRARHRGLQRTVALKLLRTARGADPEFLARFRVEAQALGALKHVNIVNVTDFGVDGRAGGMPYLVMEYLQGETLEEYCAGLGHLTLAEALPMLESIARTIDFAHEGQILHRDLKPANVFLASEGSGRTIKILDFGLARLLHESDRSARAQPTASIDSSGETASASSRTTLAQSDAGGLEDGPPEKADAEATRTIQLEERLTRRGHIMGTLAYMAPELLRGEEASRASDIYAFGILVYEVLVGTPPFGGSKAEIVRAHLDLVPTIPPEARGFISPEVEDAISPLLSKDPALRPSSAAGAITSIRIAADRALDRTWRAREIPRRVGLALLLAGVVTSITPTLERLKPIRTLENKTVDARFRASKPHPPDPRLVLITLDDASLDSDPTPLANRADSVSAGLGALFESGARAAAIDFLLPRTWSQSARFSQLVLRHEEAMTLAAFSPSEGTVIGPECIEGLTAAVLGGKRSSALFGFVNLEEDTDGVTRRGSLFYRDQAGARRSSWGSRAARTISAERVSDAGSLEHQSFWIDHSVDRFQFRRLSWKDLAGTLAKEPTAVQGRLVLLGAGFAASGDDFHRVPDLPGTKGEVSGLVLQALIVNTILAGMPIEPVAPKAALLAIFLAALVLLVIALCRRTHWLTVWSFLSMAIAWLLTSIALFRWTRTILPITSALISWSFAILLALAIKRGMVPFPGSRRADG